MGRIVFVILTMLTVLAGCYEPRYSDEPSVAPGSQATGATPDPRYRARRDSAAGSGSTIEPQK